MQIIMLRSSLSSLFMARIDEVITEEFSCDPIMSIIPLFITLFIDTG